MRTAEVVARVAEAGASARRAAAHRVATGLGLQKSPVTAPIIGAGRAAAICGMPSAPCPSSSPPKKSRPWKSPMCRIRSRASNRARWSLRCCRSRRNQWPDRPTRPFRPLKAHHASCVEEVVGELAAFDSARARTVAAPIIARKCRKPLSRRSSDASPGTIPDRMSTSTESPSVKVSRTAPRLRLDLLGTSEAKDAAAARIIDAAPQAR